MSSPTYTEMIKFFKPEIKSYQTLSAMAKNKPKMFEALRAYYIQHKKEK